MYVAKQHLGEAIVNVETYGLILAPHNARLFKDMPEDKEELIKW